MNQISSRLLRSRLIQIIVAGSCLLTFAATPDQPVRPQTPAQKKLQEMTDRGAAVADAEQRIKEIDRELSKPNLDPQTKEKLERDRADAERSRQANQGTVENLEGIGSDAHKVFEKARDARRKQHELEEARRAAANAQGEDKKKAERRVKRLELEFGDANKGIGTLPPLPAPYTIASTGSGAPSNLAAALLVEDNCKKHVMLSSVSSLQLPAMGSRELVSPKVPPQTAHRRNPLLHLVQTPPNSSADDPDAKMEWKIPKFEYRWRYDGGMTQIDPPASDPRTKSHSGNFRKFPEGIVPTHMDVVDASGRTIRIKVEPDGEFQGQLPEDFIPFKNILHVTGKDGKPYIVTYEKVDGEFRAIGKFQPAPDPSTVDAGSSTTGSTGSTGQTGAVRVTPQARGPLGHLTPKQQRSFDLGQYLAELNFLLEYGDEGIFVEEYLVGHPMSYKELEKEVDWVQDQYEVLSPQDREIFTSGYRLRSYNLNSGLGPYRFTSVDLPVRKEALDLFSKIRQPFPLLNDLTFTIQADQLPKPASAQSNGQPDNRWAITDEWTKWLTPFSLKLGRQQWDAQGKCGPETRKPPSDGSLQLKGSISYSDVGTDIRWTPKVNYQFGENYGSTSLKGSAAAENTRWWPQLKIGYSRDAAKEGVLNTKITFTPNLTLSNPEWYLDKWNDGFNDTMAKDAAGPSAQDFGWQYHGQMLPGSRIGFSLWMTDPETHGKFVHDSAFAKDWHCGEKDAPWSAAPVSSLDPAHWPRTEAAALPRATIHWEAP